MRTIVQDRETAESSDAPRAAGAPSPMFGKGVDPAFERFFGFKELEHFANRLHRIGAATKNS